MVETAAKKIVNHGTEIHQWGPAVANAMEDCVIAARRAVKRGRVAAEELMDEATHSVKQHPLQVVALTFGLALGAGALLGWIASSSHKGRNTMGEL